MATAGAVSAYASSTIRGCRREHGRSGAARRPHPTTIPWGCRGWRNRPVAPLPSGRGQQGLGVLAVARVRHTHPPPAEAVDVIVERGIRAGRVTAAWPTAPPSCARRAPEQGVDAAIERRCCPARCRDGARWPPLRSCISGSPYIHDCAAAAHPSMARGDGPARFRSRRCARAVAAPRIRSWASGPTKGTVAGRPAIRGAKRGLGMEVKCRHGHLLGMSSRWRRSPSRLQRTTLPGVMTPPRDWETSKDPEPRAPEPSRCR